MDCEAKQEARCPATILNSGEATTSRAHYHKVQDATRHET